MTETNYLYSGTDSSCKNLNSYTRYEVVSGTTWSYVANFYSVTPINQIKTAVYTYGPIFVGIGVDSSFDVYTGGIYSSTGSVDHEVDLVSWETDGSGKTYWISKKTGVSVGERGTGSELTQDPVIPNMERPV